MELRFERAILGSLACRHRFVNDGDRVVNIAGAGFGFGERNLDEPVESQSVLIALKLDATAHVHDPPAKRVGCPGQAVKKDSRPLATTTGHAHAANRAASTVRGAAREQLPRMSLNIAARCPPKTRVWTWARPAIRASASRPREIARSMSPIGHNVSASWSIAATPVSCPKRKARSSSRPLKQRDSAFQMAARFAVLSGEIMREPSCAMSDASLSRIGPKPRRG